MPQYHNEKLILPLPSIGSVKGNIKFMSDEKFMKSLGAYRTCNNMGFSVDQIDDACQYWLSSMPNSKNPLHDLGAGLGFQTAAAIKRGRNVVAVDAGEKNLDILKQRVLDLTAQNTSGVGVELGRLEACIHKTLPDETACGKEQSAGVLLSHVIHFLPGNDAVSLFKHVHGWLERGAFFVVTTISPALYAHLSRLMGNAISDVDLEKKFELLNKSTEDNIIKSDIWRLQFPVLDENTDMLPKVLYSRSTNELRALALSTGFEIAALHYVPFDFGSIFSSCEPFTHLVARKPV